MKIIYYNTIFRRLSLFCLLLTLFPHHSKASEVAVNNGDSVVTELITDTVMSPNYKLIKKTTYSGSNMLVEYRIDTTSVIKPLFKSKMLKSASVTDTCSGDFTLPNDYVTYVSDVSGSSVDATKIPEVKDNCGNIIVPEFHLCYVYANSVDYDFNTWCTNCVIDEYVYDDKNGHIHYWRYIIKLIEPELKELSGGKTVHCKSECVDPALPTVLGDCGYPIRPILSSVTDLFETKGVIVFKYLYKRYLNSAIFPDPYLYATYTYTYTILNDFTLPANVTKTVTNPTEAIAPTTLPNVVDGNGNVLTPSGPEISENSEGIKWERTYTYTYTNCNGTQKQWKYCYIATKTLQKKCLRSLEQTYDTRNYYVKGNLLSSAVYDSVQRVQQKTNYIYYAYQIKARRAKVKRRRYDNNRYYETDVAHLTDNLVATSPLKYTENIQYIYDNNNQVSSLITSQDHYTYHTDYEPSDNRFADLKSYRHSDKRNLQEDGSGDYNYEVSVDYSTDNMTKKYYVTGMPTEHIVKDMTGKTYRHSKAYYADWFFPTHLTCVTNYLNDTDTASTLIKYNNVGNILSVKLPSQMSYKYTYDMRYHMYVSSITDTLGYTTLSDNINYKYGVPCRNTDENGNMMLIKLDNLGRIISYTGPNEVANHVPYTIAFDYHPTITKSGDSNITDPAYAITKHYDAQHPDNPIETVTFCDGFGKPIQVKKDAFIDGAQKMIVSGQVKYDAFGRAVEVYYPQTDDISNKIQLYNYPTNDALVTKTEYDVLDRVTQVTLPDNSKMLTNYSIENNLLKTLVTDANENEQATFTNGSGQTVRTEQYYKKPEGGTETITTTFEYDDINQLIKVTDAMNKETLSEYDMAGRRTKVTHPASGVTTFGYDPAGNLSWKYTANKDSIKYAYDYNRLKSISYPRHPENDVKYSYGGYDNTSGTNCKGRVKLIEDGSGAQEFKYGKMGELTEVRRTLVIPNQAVATYITKWDYDSWNRVQNMTYPDGEVVNYFYDLGGNLASVTGNSNYITNISYDKFEQRKSITYGNGTVTNYEYNDTTRRLYNLKVQSGVNAIMNNTYGYDAVGNVLSVTNNASPIIDQATQKSIGGGITHTYGYDNLYRLTSAQGTFTGANGKTAHYDLAMKYDNLHNITYKKQDITQTDLQFTGTLKAGYELNYAYNSNNAQQIASIEDASYRGETDENKDESEHLYRYDGNGNLLQVSTGTMVNDSVMKATSERKLLWDEENRLAAISDNGYVSNYIYDASGERTVKMHGGSEVVMINGKQAAARLGAVDFTAYVSPYLVVSPGGNYTKHIYAGSQRIASELANGMMNAESTTKAGSDNSIYTTKTSLIQTALKAEFDSLGVKYQNISSTFAGTGEALSSDSLVYFYHPDHLGSSSLITGSNGAVLQHIEYVPYGEVFIEEKNATWRTPYKFNAKELDEETGLYYYGARYYDPKTSVWISSDPLRGKYPNISSYVYAADNPIKFIDPDGKDIMINLYCYPVKKYMNYLTIKSTLYNFNVNLDLPYPVQGISLAPMKPIPMPEPYNQKSPITGLYKFDEISLLHGKPDAVAISLGINVGLGKGAGGEASVGLIMKGDDAGKIGMYYSVSKFEGIDVSVGVQANFIYAKDISKFSLLSLAGYSQGVQLSAGYFSASKFTSYNTNGVLKDMYDYITTGNIEKKEITYTGFSYGVGFGASLKIKGKNIPLSIGTTYSQYTNFAGEVTNMHNNNTSNNQTDR